PAYRFDSAGAGIRCAGHRAIAGVRCDQIAAGLRGKCGAATDRRDDRKAVQCGGQTLGRLRMASIALASLLPIRPYWARWSSLPIAMCITVGLWSMGYGPDSAPEEIRHERQRG